MTNRTTLGLTALHIFAASALVGCPGPTTPAGTDAGGLDALVIRVDSGAADAPGSDTPMTPVDAPMIAIDSPASTDDAFTVGADAFMPGADAFVAWPTDPGAQDTMLRGVSGMFTAARPGTGRVVSPRPLGRTAPTGLFVQGPGAPGPARFTTLDPATLTPTPTVGDVVSFEVTAAADSASGMGSTGDQHRVTAITGYTRTATGMTVAAQNVSALDLPSMIDAHESELVTVMGAVAAAGTPAGAGFTSFQVTTTGVPTASAALRVRLPTTLVSSLSPAPAVGCQVAVGPTPLWRFTTSAQPSAWRASEITVSCPTRAPAVGEVFFSEVGYTFAGSDNDKEFVELHNPSSAVTYDLSGCILSDNGGAMDADAITLPAGTRIAPGDYFVFAGSASEIVGDAVLPAGLGLGGDDSVQLHCGGVVVDDVTWTASGIGGADEVSAQLDMARVTMTGAMANDMAANWCSTPAGSTYGAMSRRGTPGAANVACMAAPACPAATHLVINEIDYDQTGADTAEFVEIHNPTSAAIDLAGYALVAVNGTAAGPEYARVALTGSIAAGGYVLVTAMGSTVAGATLSLPMPMQNGMPDGIVLVGPTGIVDAAIYEGTMPMVTLMGATAVALAESGSIGTDGGADGLSRRPNGCDRDMPTMDWAAAPLTPGAANSM